MSPHPCRMDTFVLPRVPPFPPLFLPFCLASSLGPLFSFLFRGMFSPSHRPHFCITPSNPAAAFVCYPSILFLSLPRRKFCTARERSLKPGMGTAVPPEEATPGGGKTFSTTEERSQRGKGRGGGRNSLKSRFSAKHRFGSQATLSAR